MQTVIDVKDLYVAYRKKIVLSAIHVSILGPSLTAIIGPNGAGKSTFLHALLNLVPPLQGEIRIFGEPYAKVRDKIGFVPQKETVDWDFPTTVWDVVSMGRYGKRGWLKPLTAIDRQKVTESLERVGMEHFAHRQIGELSGGQKQRVFLARALAQEAELYMLDEPFAGVDAATEQAIFQVLTQLKEDGRTIVVVHHDLASVKRYFDHV
ncbi:MAG: ABC transporter ATP-binding protein, partial [Candidatus Carbobacillus sp.]|nr:ABC transporter ATP-binding protein [Candidatus Carbobacillus sp.]